MTISLVAVFIPVLFMGGIVGRLLHEFSVTITVAILISGFVSLTFTPMLGSRFLRYSHTGHHGRAVRRVRERLPWFDFGLRLYAQEGPAAFLRHHDGGRAAAGRHRVSVSSPCPPASSPARTADSSSASPWPARIFPSTPWPNTCGPYPTSCSGIRTWRDTGTFLMGGNQGGFFASMKPRSERQAVRRSDHRGAAAQGIHGSRHHGVPAESAAHHGERAIHHQRLPDDAAERQSHGHLRLGAAPDG